MTCRAVSVNPRHIFEHRVYCFGQWSNLHAEPCVQFRARFDAQPVVFVREHPQIKTARHDRPGET